MRLSSLHDIKSLKDKIDELRGVAGHAIAGMGHIEQLEVEAMVRPEILVYIKRHGMPPNGAFDPILMAAIVEELEEPCH